MNRPHRLRVLSLVVFGAVATAACSSRSIIGEQRGTGGSGGTGGSSAGGTGGTWGNGGLSGSPSPGDAGSSGTAGIAILVGDAGTSGTAGVPGDSPGTAGSLGSAGTSGSAGNANVCPSASGGTAGTGLPLGPPTEYATNRYGSFVEMGDLNGDGRARNIVAANYFFLGPDGHRGCRGKAWGRRRKCQRLPEPDRGRLRGAASFRASQSAVVDRCRRSGR